MRLGIKKPWTRSGPRLVASDWRPCRRLVSSRRAQISRRRRHSVALPDGTRWERSSEGSSPSVDPRVMVGGRTARESSDLLTVAAAGVYDRPGADVKVGRGLVHRAREVADALGIRVGIERGMSGWRSLAHG